MKKNNYSSFIENLYSEAKTAGWKIFYEEESDSLFWTKKPFPAADRLAKVAKEISFYLSSGGMVDGLMIQPFQSNFLSHNEEISGFAKLLNHREHGGIVAIPQGRGGGSESLFATLSATIQKDIYKDAAEANYPVKKLEKFLSASAK